MRGDALCALVVAAAVIGPVAPRSASACRCAPVEMRRLVLPADAARDLPLDGQVRVLLSGFPVRLRAALPQEYRLRDDTGGLVRTRRRLVATRLDLIPEAPLRPQAHYTLEEVCALDGQRRCLSDRERWDLAEAWTRRHREPAAPPPRVWVRRASFTTEGAADARTPAAPAVRSAHVDFAYGGGDCGPGTSLHAGYDLPAAGAAPTDVLELEIKGRGVLASFVPAPRSKVLDGIPWWRWHPGLAAAAAGGAAGAILCVALALLFRRRRGAWAVGALALALAGGVAAITLASRLADRPAGAYSVRLGDTMCMPDKVHLGFDGPFEVRLALLSITDRRSPAGPWRHARGRADPSLVAEVRETHPGEDPAEPAVVARWLEGPIGEGPAAGAAAPTAEGTGP